MSAGGVSTDENLNPNSSSALKSLEEQKKKLAQYKNHYY
jgi:hypothetical protein